MMEHRSLEAQSILFDNSYLAVMRCSAVMQIQYTGICPGIITDDGSSVRL